MKFIATIARKFGLDTELYQEDRNVNHPSSTEKKRKGIIGLAKVPLLAFLVTINVCYQHIWHIFFFVFVYVLWPNSMIENFSARSEWIFGLIGIPAPHTAYN